MGHWKCNACNGMLEGPAIPSCSCGGFVAPLLSGMLAMKEALIFTKALTERAEHVAGLLGFDWYEHVSFAYVNADNPNAMFTVEGLDTWDYGGSEHRSEDIPLRYLWVSDTEVQEEEAAKKAAEEAEARAMRIRQAELVVEQARRRAQTAEASAQTAVATAEANLAALLRGAS